MSIGLQRALEAMAVAFPEMVKVMFTRNLPLAVASFFFGQILALIIALMRLSKPKALRGLSAAYVWVIRGVPLVVLLFIVFYGLPRLGIIIPSTPTAIIGLSACVGAYDSEIYRSAITSVAKGQWEASRALGMTTGQTLRHVVLPQAVPIAIPPLGNSFISLTRDTSILSVLAVSEVFYTSQKVTAIKPEPLALYIEVGLLFLAISIVLTRLQAWSEAKVGKHLAAQGMLKS